MLEYPEKDRYLHSAVQPLKRLHRAQIVVKGQVKATLQGEDVSSLKDRAHRFASAQGWHRAVVQVVNHA
ncbi:hypothetical protein ACOJCM_14745 [Billgrantia sp. LNSP4103-1]|uniref:hypothetical protein n=1 Tax=Billgrantia sp. LNSP4103-1 TaxID=3410266 RepID=UPI00403F31C4